MANNNLKIFVRTHGGLGNQIFQYCFGRSLSLSTKRSFVLDTRPLEKNARFPFGLGHFNITREVLGGLLPPQRKGQRLKYFLYGQLGLLPELIVERGLAFNNRLSLPNKDVYLDGYWQSERYFSDVAETIREDLRIITPPSPENATHLAAIATCPAVSLHVRRGDYLTPKHQAYHGSCSMDYYAKALEFVASRMTAEPIIYVFSDEPEWARDNLTLPFQKRVMAHNDSANSYEDMRLMSACRHHIIANSTFSWWGAWLNPSPDKIVVAPQRWFADPKVDNPDIVPDGWHRIAG